MGLGTPGIGGGGGLHPGAVEGDVGWRVPELKMEIGSSCWGVGREISCLEGCGSSAYWHVLAMWREICSAEGCTVQ